MCEARVDPQGQSQAGAGPWRGVTLQRAAGSDHGRQWGFLFRVPLVEKGRT